MVLKLKITSIWGVVKEILLGKYLKGEFYGSIATAYSIPARCVQTKFLVFPTNCFHLSRPMEVAASFLLTCFRRKLLIFAVFLKPGISEKLIPL